MAESGDAGKVLRALLFGKLGFALFKRVFEKPGRAAFAALVFAEINQVIDEIRLRAKGFVCGLERLRRLAFQPDSVCSSLSRMADASLPSEVDGQSLDFPVIVPGRLKTAAAVYLVRQRALFRVDFLTPCLGFLQRALGGGGEIHETLFRRFFDAGRKARDLALAIGLRRIVVFVCHDRLRLVRYRR